MTAVVSVRVAELDYARPMLAYREAPAGAPLVSMIANHVVALDPEIGAVRWKQEVGRDVSRILVTAGIVFVAVDGGSGSTLLMFDVATGAPTGSLALPFFCRNTLVSGDRIYFAGTKGILALRSDGRVLFRVSHETKEMKLREGDLGALVGHDATGAEIWRLPNMVVQTNASYLSLGDDVSQIDRDT